MSADSQPPDPLSLDDTALPCSATITSREQAIDFLLGRINFERTPSVPYGERQLKLDRMRQLLNRLGSPDAGLPIVHVAGTKGKGSTSALVAAILAEAGYDAGLFSSPHLEAIEERFAINGQAIAASELVTLTERLRPVVEAMDREAAEQADDSLSPTYFELTTALALMHFAERGVDLAVLEVGLGGRLDSTNVCQPVVSVITSISFDHTKQLGNTLAEIAGEKAGIIKPGVPVLCGPMLPEPQEVIAGVARQHGSRLIVAGEDFEFDYQIGPVAEDNAHRGQIAFRSRDREELFELSPTPLGMLGEHQGANAALALATIIELRHQGWLVSSEAMRLGLAQHSLPARVEVICRRPTVILDVAHNVAAAEALAEVLQSHFPTTERTLLLAATREKDVAGIARVLVPHFQHIVVTEYVENPRAVPTARLAEIVEAEVLRLKETDAFTSGSKTVEPNEQVVNPRRRASSILETEPKPGQPAASAVGSESSDQNLNFGILKVQQEADPRLAWQMVQATLHRESLACVTGSFFIAAELRPVLLATCGEDFGPGDEPVEPQPEPGNN